MKKNLVKLAIVFVFVLIFAGLTFISFANTPSEITRLKPLLTTIDMLTRLIIGTPVPFIGQ